MAKNWHIVDFLRSKAFGMEQTENFKIIVKTLEKRVTLSQSILLEKIKPSYLVLTVLNFQLYSATI